MRLNKFHIKIVIRKKSALPLGTCQISHEIFMFSGSSSI